MPPYEVVPIARFDGWKFDERNIGLNYCEGEWDGKHYNLSAVPLDGGKGQRPIVVYFGGSGKDVAVQFVENKNVIVGKFRFSYHFDI